jgi:hypothetical protein
MQVVVFVTTIFDQIIIVLAIYKGILDTCFWRMSGFVENRLLQRLRLPILMGLVRVSLSVLVLMFARGSQI